jgi:hypothetical protein
MKILQLLNKKEYLIDENTAVEIEKSLVNEAKFIKIQGDLIVTHQIALIYTPEKKPYFMGNEMTKDLNYVWKEGQKIPFNNMYKDRIEWKEQLPESINNKLLN